MKKLRIAIIGCGRISTSYADAFRKLENMIDVCYAVDTDIDRAKSFAEQFHCEYTADYEDLIGKNIDVVHLCLPHYLHPALAIWAMKAGINVLVEKPVAITLQDADKMIDVQKQTGVQLGVIFQTRYNKGVQTIKRLIAENKLGKISGARSYLTWTRPDSYYEESNWKGTWDKEGGGVLIDQAIHSIDRVRYILGSDVEWIEGSIHNYRHEMIKVEDTAEAVVKFKNGCLYNLYACNLYTDNSPITIEFHGEKGRAGLIQDMGFIDLDGMYTEIRNTHDEVKVGPDYWGSCHDVQIRDFYESVLNDTKVSVDGTEGRKTLEIIKGIYLSSQQKKRIVLPFEDTAIEEIVR
ncbi:Gfo/Idh/MocA family protein [Caproiciproducens sp.]|uniref:Gfo/Idh/MocA family protein n=1 Tax=Caproiciproducens sp. TaxID=1954376 RepID=UPI00289901AE|nr:Gfo/Idh/MocA family oxidoreductase [Caproiciproducens sp.]